MGRTKRQSTNPTDRFGNTEYNMKMFHGWKLDPGQIAFKNAILNPKNLVVFCNSCAGTGKTTIALGAAEMLRQRGLVDHIIYMVHPAMDKRQGFLPGTLLEKSMPVLTPLFQAMDKLGIDQNAFVSSDTILDQKCGASYIYGMTDTYIRGTTLSNAAIIMDESQNYSQEDIKTAITRVPDDSKLIVIGHDGQCDIDDEDSGFAGAIEHFSDRDWAEICNLTVNHRGLISEWADKMFIKKRGEQNVECENREGDQTVSSPDDLE